MSDKKSAILKAAKGLTENYASEELFMPKSGRRLPNRSVIIDIVRDLKSIVFPGYFSTDTSATIFPEYYVGHRLNDIYDRLKNQIEIALLYHGEEPEEAAARADRTTCGFFEQLPEIQRLLLTDVQAGFDGDPAAKSKEEIIFSYPGLGNLAVSAITSSDYNLIQGYVLWLALIYMVINLIVDASYIYIDPRMRLKE